ncbi:hypothetical protein [Arachidicoccus soli]|nr:hypothetical protein [Arachidicoccus soli]
MALEQLLSNLGVYVQFTALGDDQALMSSGFPLRKTPAPVGKLPVGETVIAVSNYIGEVSLSVNTIKGASSYMWQYQKTDATDGIWHSLPVTKTHTTISGLESATEYSFKVAGVGANPSLNYSKVVKCVII